MLLQFRFEPGLAGLPEVSAGKAGRYVERYRGERPWLQVVEEASPEVQRIFAVPTWQARTGTSGTRAG